MHSVKTIIVEGCQMYLFLNEIQYMIIKISFQMKQAGER